jgi:hypothetical protein
LAVLLRLRNQVDGRGGRGMQLGRYVMSFGEMPVLRCPPGAEEPTWLTPA